MRFAVEYWGVSFAVECHVPEFEPEVAKLLLPVWKDEPTLSPSATFKLKLSDSGEPELEGPDIGVPIIKDDLLETLERQIHLYIATSSPKVVFVHAGVVRWQNAAILLPGRSFAGKSTLTQALCQLGASYMSDEYAIIDTNGDVHPFPRPMSQRHPEGNRRIEAAELGWTGQTEPIRARAVFSVRYDKDKDFELEEITSGKAVLELLSNTVSARSAPSLAMTCLGRAITNAYCWKGTRGEASKAASRLLELSLEKS